MQSLLRTARSTLPKMDTTQTTSSLIPFLSQCRALLFGTSTNHPKPPAATTFVLGNPSADLDSFISAVVFSFAYSRNHQRQCAPLVNLFAVPSSDLWRLRPEFGTALWFATQAKDPSSINQDKDEVQDEEKQILQSNMITIHDLQHNEDTKTLFPTTGLPESSNAKPLSVVLVDHNAPAIPNISSEYLSTLNLVGCIDHHEDESKVPCSASPRIIKTGIGSCTTLVVQHLRDANLWPFPDTNSDSTTNQSAATQLSILALAPIIIDTANLTAPGKVSELDRETVSFLERIIHQCPSHKTFDRSKFYEAVSRSKETSLDNLTIEEILDRDYKEWTETSSSSSSSSSSKSVKIGISSSLKPISYLLQKSNENSNPDPNSPTSLIPLIKSFSHSKSLDIHILMTAYTSPDSKFHREILLLPLTSQNSKFVSEFIHLHSEELGLQPWHFEQTTTTNAFKERFQPFSSLSSSSSSSEPKAHDNVVYVFNQTALEKSRKQVGPMIRDTVRKG
ncbi:putative exopolyphosphatase [Phaeomoniella chlamydospora]|uniref:Putative exopolyphosphatase n=1 Tax=Phaeomoniella chlamydospora TaxID=158046 RepID=A0A0G2EJS0_PHACM|nr:putative exopolyphosphatase [Phaeomoniella chlamydospora]